MTPRLLGAEDVTQRCDVGRAVDALEQALLDGFDPELDPPRSALPLDGGELLVMPSTAAGAVAVKLLTIGGDPRVQGVCVVFDAATLAPAAVIDGAALTLLRTAAVSALAIRHLAHEGARRIVVFGRGPQARAHVAALASVCPAERIDVVGRDDGDVDALVAQADVICCCTTAREPLFDGRLVSDHATVVAIGSHHPDARETDDALLRRAGAVVVESRDTALREAGDVIAAVEAGAVAPDALIPLRDLVRGEATVPPDRPRVFKGTGMAWQDAVVGAAIAGLGARSVSPCG